MPDPKKQRAEAIALARELLERLERSDLRELAVTRDGIRVHVRRGEAPRATPSVADEPAAVESVEPAPARAEAAHAEVRAPLTGIFYRAPSPQAAPYVQVGSTVVVGQVIGLIEAMKLFNEIRSTAAGRVRRILVETGQLVRAHAPLIEVEPP